MVDVTEAFVGYVRVNLGCGDVGVAKEGLDGADIGAIDEEIGGETVAQHMRSSCYRDTCLNRVFFHNFFDCSRC